MTTVAIGDVVYLASDSARVTVTELDSEGNANLIGVSWSNGGQIMNVVIPAGAVVTTDRGPAIAAAQAATAAAVAGQTTGNTTGG